MRRSRPGRAERTRGARWSAASWPARFRAGSPSSELSYPLITISDLSPAIPNRLTPSGDTLFNIGTFSQIHIPVTPPPLLRGGSVTSSRTSRVDTVRANDEVQGQRRLQGADRDGDLHGNGKRLPIAGVCVIDRAAARRYRDGERLQRGVGVA